MRRHSDKNRKQHEDFIDQVQVQLGLYARSIEWFKIFPLWLELDGFRVVHAYWSDDAISKVKQWMAPGTSMSADFVVKANQKGTDEYDAIEMLWCRMRPKGDHDPPRSCHRRRERDKEITWERLIKLPGDGHGLLAGVASVVARPKEPKCSIIST